MICRGSRERVNHMDETLGFEIGDHLENSDFNSFDSLCEKLFMPALSNPLALSAAPIPLSCS